MPQWQDKLWRDRVARQRALRLAASGDHIGALATSRDVQVLSRLGLHMAVLAATEATESAGTRLRREARFASALAHAELGDVERAIQRARPEWHWLNATEKLRFIGAAGRWDARAVAPLASELGGLVKAALDWSLGDVAGLRRQLEDRNVRATPRSASDLALLRASLASSCGNHTAARAAANAAFTSLGLTSPLAAEGGPISLRAFRASPGSAPTNQFDVTGSPTVSVVMPAHNMAATIGTAARSILDQVGVQVELIVVDDGSTDDTVGALQRDVGTDARLKVRRHGQSRGAYAARNTGLAVAAGDYLAFNDADDWSHPERLHRSVSRLRANPEIMGIESRMARISHHGHFVAPRIFPLIRANRSSLVCRRLPIIEALGAFEDTRVGADEEFAARIVACFGARALQRMPVLLAVGLQSATGLTGHLDTGVASRQGIANRLNYREMWHDRHCALARQVAPTWRMLPDKHT